MRLIYAASAVLAALVTGASAQQPQLTGTAQLGRRLFGQLCGVCHLKPHLTSGPFDRMKQTRNEPCQRRHAMRSANLTLAGLLAALVSTTSLVPARAADAILSGSIAAASGEKMSGVTVSAKAEGATITTSVYT